MATARAMANVPRGGQRQTLTGLDTYHQYIVQESRLKPDPLRIQRPKARLSGADRVERPYTARFGSFSTPHPTGHTPSSSQESNIKRPSSAKADSPTISTSDFAPVSDQTTQGTPINSRARRVRLASPASRRGLLETPSTDPAPSEPLVDVNLPWRPPYLKRRVLLSFALLLAGLIAVIEALLVISTRNTGVGPPTRLLRYAWQYAPPAVVTLVAAIWTRVEYQAKASAPWIRLSRGPSDVRTLTLDYTSMVAPQAIFRAVRNRDWLVVAITLAGLVFKLLIVFSVALVTPVRTNVEDHLASIAVQRAFVDNASGLQNPSSIPLFTMLGLQTTDLTFPDGTSRDFAFQSFDANLPATAELRATVEGFQGRLECEPAQTTLNSVQLLQGSTTRLDVTVAAPSCRTTQSIMNNLLSSNASALIPRVFMAFQGGDCGSTQANDDQRFVIMVGTITVDPASFPRNPNARDIPLRGALPQSAAVICRPTYDLGPVEVVKNGTDLLSIRRLNSTQPRTLNTIHPWDFARAQFELYDEARLNGSVRATDKYYDNPDQVVIDSDGIIDVMMAMEVKANGVPQLGNLLDTATLDRLASAYWTQFSALLARNEIMAGARQQTVGRAVLVGERLLVRTVPTHLMAALFGVIVLVCLLAVDMVPRLGFLPRDPSTILDMATLLAHSRPLLQCLRGTGAADETTIHDRLEGSTYRLGVEPYEKTTSTSSGYFKILGGFPPPLDAPLYFQHTGQWKRPLSLQLWTRGAVIAVLGGMIASLEVALRASRRNQGIAGVSDIDYLHFLWTSGPALLLLGLALYHSAADFATRSLAPFAKLRGGGELSTTVGLDFLNKSKPRVIWSALRTGNPSVLITSITAFFATLVVIFSGALFTPVPVWDARNVVLQSADFFANTTVLPAGLDPDSLPPADSDAVLSSLILNANASFPAFTFNDLNFPAMQLQGALPNDYRELQDIAIEATIPALRPNLQCRLYPQSEISTNMTIDNLFINVDAEPCRVGNSGQQTSNAQFPAIPGASGPTALFGRATSRRDNRAQCSDFLYIWGQLDNPSSPSSTVSSVSAMGCNETLETVAVLTTLRGPSLRIDPTIPPRVTGATATLNAVALPVLQYSRLANLTATGGNLLDPFFSALTSSDVAVPAAALSDTGLDTAGRVADAVVAQHKVIRAQNLNLNIRRSLSAQGNFPFAGNGVTIGTGGDAAAAQPRVAGVLRSVNNSGARRLEVDEIAARVLQVVLGVVLLGCIVGLILAIIGGLGIRGEGMVPRQGRSIASIAALLADGNVFGFLGRGAEWMKQEEIEADFKDGGLVVGFGLGWEVVRARRRGDGVRRYGSDLLGDEELEFGLKVVRAGGWQGGVEVGLGTMARVTRGQRGFVRARS
ncbi:hypothetical protein D7B24_008683 [Verticillium nonalfalfae]|uniref:Uncharacterized protein n=1 Tax=Verticillium nonalfalfae TaxID=1051616 RepID=A0A3M9YK09_9PEZI|nr:uncharacterized protein D7B24_008683 [Verticillium nonalfalfae]RNJ60302.1 hypothetical protein D7B24_008683 [Verticillium nonalfalfae]